MAKRVSVRALRLGCTLIDRDHEVLLKIIERLRIAVAQGELTALKHLMISTEAYFDAHIENEEELMRAWDYPAAEAHKREHVTMRSQVHVLADAILGGHTELAATTLQLLNDWLCKHILGVDRQLALHLTSVGATKKRPSARVGVLQPQPTA